MTGVAHIGCGHGHVYPNPDGSLARCGGPLICSKCALDLARKQGAVVPSSKLRVAGFELRIENIRITLCEDPEHIALDRDGEGGHFSIREFADVLHQFMSERL
jgi:hypothetical protein